MSTIPSGYQLHITSWEKDADNYKTEILSGLTKEDVQFYIHFLSYFGSYQHLFGNKRIEDYPDAEKIAITSAYKTGRPTTPQLLEDVENSIEDWKTGDDSWEWVDETIGTWHEGERYRVYDYCKVYLVHTPIPNVTEEFRAVTELAQGSSKDPLNAL